MGKRRLAREAALQALYLSDVSSMGAAEAFKSLAGIRDMDAQTAEFARDLAEGAEGLRGDIDARLQAIALNWELRRMAAVDRSLLRLAAYEILRTQTPIRVVIDEAIEMAKKFSAEDSPRFINGILDKLQGFRVGGADSSAGAREGPPGAGPDGSNT